MLLPSKAFFRSVYTQRREGDKKDRIKEIRRNRGPGLSFQTGMSEYLTNRFVKNSGTEEIAHYVEDLVLYVTVLVDCQSWKGMISATLQYIKTFSNKSLVGRVAELLKSMDSENFLDFQGGGDLPTWLSALKRGELGWKIFTENPAFKQLSKLISMAGAVGLCDLTKFDYDFNGIKVFSLQAYHKHVKATDLLNAFFETIVYFVEGGYWSLRNGNLDHFLYSDGDITKLEEEYWKLKDLANHVRSGSLEKNTGISENDYSKRLEALIERLSYFIKSVPRGFERNMISGYLSELRRFQTDFNIVRTSGKLRIAPFSTFIHGNSGVGKTTIAKLVMIQTLKAGGFDCSDDRMCTLNSDDKYMSNYKTHINGLFLDDMGNTQANYIEKAPTAKMIEVINNVSAYANMAEADMKGRVSIEPKAVVITSNLELERLGNQYSNEKFSIVRRAPIHLLVKVKEEYALPDGRLDPSKVPSGTVPDIWTIRVGIPDSTQNSLLTTSDNHSIKQVLELIRDHAVKHFKQQDKLVELNTDIAEKMNFCETCVLPCDVCSCSEPMDKLFEEEEVKETPFIFLRDKPKKERRGFSHQSGTMLDFDDPDDDDFYPINFDLSMYLHEYLTNGMLFCHKYGIGIFRYCTNNYFTDLFSFLSRESQSAYCMISSVILPLARYVMPAYLPSWSLYMFVPFLFFHAICLHLHSCLIAYKRYTSIKGKLTYLMMEAKKLDKQKVCSTILAVAGMVALYKLFTRAKKSFQGNIMTRSDDDVDIRDKDVNPWLVAKTVEMPASDYSSCSTPDRLCSLVKKNLAYLRVVDEGDKLRICDIFFLGSNVALIPNHMWLERKNLTIQVIKDDPRGISSTFNTIISKAHSVHVPNTDLSMVYIASGGSWKNLVKYFPLSNLRRCSGTMIYKDKMGVTTEYKAMISPNDRVSVQNIVYNGFSYTLPIKTFRGLCMATWVSDTPAPVILGFHLAGINENYHGVAGTISQSEINTCMNQLSEIPGVCLSKDSGKMLTEQYGIDFYEGQKIHEKSPVNFLESPAQVNYYGMVKGRATYNSDVVPTRISKIVTEVTGVPSIWGKPKFYPNWRPFYANVSVVADPASPFEGDLLCAAVNDYLGHISSVLEQLPRMKKSIKKLERIQNICGIPGVRFIDAIPAKTSLGFPLTGAKRTMMTDLDPEMYAPYQDPRELSEEIWLESEKMESIYLTGERTYPIFKGCLKDEPTKKTKDKVRVFQAAPVALQLLIRKYFLPVVRFLQMCPTDSEMAVGVNAQGPEWDQLSRHIMRYGKERILAGDYSKYDTRMPAQMTLCAFDILISLAKQTGNYTEDDISIMRGIATDCCYPTIAMNGDLIQFFGSNPSGNNITVIINCLVNSLNLRCAFFSLSPSPELSFRDVASLITYGDDFKASISKGNEWFNHIAVAKFLAKYGQILTMPDKESVATEFMDDKDVDFLKRKNVYNEEFGLYMGALDENSIFKSLHSVLKSSAISNEEQCAYNIGGALREWFAYGRDTYEFRRSQMIEVADRAGLSHMVGDVLSRTYDDKMTEFRLQYLEELPPESPGEGASL